MRRAIIRQAPSTIALPRGSTPSPPKPPSWRAIPPLPGPAHDTKNQARYRSARRRIRNRDRDRHRGAAGGAGGSPLHGVFIEDEELISLSVLPFACQVTLGSGLEPLTKLHIEDHFRAFAGRARRDLSAAAERCQVKWSFEIVRGPLDLAPLGRRAEVPPRASGKGTEVILDMEFGERLEPGAQGDLACEGQDGQTDQFLVFDEDTVQWGPASAASRTAVSIAVPVSDAASSGTVTRLIFCVMRRPG